MKYLKRSLYIDTLSLSGKLTCTLFLSYYRTKFSIVKHRVSSKFLPPCSMWHCRRSVQHKIRNILSLVLVGLKNDSRNFSITSIPEHLSLIQLIFMQMLLYYLVLQMDFWMSMDGRYCNKKEILLLLLLLLNKHKPVFS